MAWLNIGEALLGVVVVASTALDVFRVVIMPRPFYGQSISKLLIREVWWLWRRIAVYILGARQREGWLSASGQVGLLLLLMYWVTGLVVGYALILHALRAELSPQPVDFWLALYMSGTSLLTLGLGDVVPTGIASRLVIVVTAASGPALIGVTLSLLFSLYSSFQRREALITTLDASAGAPPSGMRLLETYANLQLVEELPALFRSWELWTAEVLDTHLAYPLLMFFRSTHDHESWISALGAVLDAATLAIAAIDTPAGNAELMYGLGCHAVEDLSNYFGLTHEHRIGVERAEFVDVFEALAAAGYPMLDLDAAWESFCSMRARYAGPLNALAVNFVTPPALWIGDRSTLHDSSPR